MNDIAARILHLIEQRGLSYAELSQITNISKSALQRYATGETAKIPLDRLKLMADALGVSQAHLMGWEEEVPPIPGAFPYKPTRSIPIVGRVAAGLPVLAEEYIEGYIEIDYKDSGEYFGLRVSGDSMNAANIHDGNILIIRKQPEVENGQIAVVIVNGYDGTVKRYYRNGDMVTLMPQSTNPDHQPQMYNINETEIRIVGKAVENRISLE